MNERRKRSFRFIVKKLFQRRSNLIAANKTQMEIATNIADEKSENVLARTFDEQRN